MNTYTATARDGSDLSFKSKATWTHIAVAVETGKVDPDRINDYAEAGRHIRISDHKSEQAALNSLRTAAHKKYLLEEGYVSEIYVIELS